MARVAHRKLSSLENDNAPFTSQIEQVALFSNCTLSQAARNTHNTRSQKEKDSAYTRQKFHARQEWSLRWLLKKLQAEREARLTPQSWELLGDLFAYIPLSNLSKILKERKFASLLKQTLQDVLQQWESPTLDEKPTTAQLSRKRNHSGELLEIPQLVEDGREQDIRESLFAVVDFLSQNSNLEGAVSRFDGEKVLVAEYLKSVLRTTSEESAQILGSWLSFSKHIITHKRLHDVPWSFSPLIWIWTIRIPGGDDFAQFSKHCLPPAAALLSESRLSAPLTAELEELISRNVVIAAKAAFTSAGSPASYKELLTDFIRHHPENAPVIFDILVRSLPRPSLGRHDIKDASFIQETFLLFMDDIKSRLPEARSNILIQLLHCCHELDVTLDPQVLKSIVVDFGFMADNKLNCEVLGALVKLDATIFVIQDGASLLDELFSRITIASLTEVWPTLADTVVNTILVPLLEESARTRTLLHFLHSWHAQMATLEELNPSKASNSGSDHATAWEDDALQFKLRQIMESSLTVQQIVGLIQWLEAQLSMETVATMVLLDTVTRAVIHLQTAELIVENVHRILSSDLDWKHMDDRSSILRLRIITRLIQWPVPFGLSAFNIRELVNIPETSSAIYKVESFRFACAALTSNITSDIRVNDLLLGLILKVYGAIDIDEVKKALEDKSNDDWGQKTPPNPGIAWQLSAQAHCILVENPRILELYTTELVNFDSKNLSPVKFLIWMASLSKPHPPDYGHQSWISRNSHVFADFWNSIAQNLELLDNKTIGDIISLILESRTHMNNPFGKSGACNGFVVSYLNRLPLEVFSRRHRETILTSWAPESSDQSSYAESLAYTMSPLDPEVLGLKLKIMEQAPLLHEGASFHDLIKLAKATTTQAAKPLPVLKLVKDFGRATIRHITATIDQAKSLKYFRQALEFCATQSFEEEDSRSLLSTSVIIMIETVLVLPKHVSDRFNTVDKDLLQKWDLERGRTRSKLLGNLQALLALEFREDNRHDSCAALSVTLDTLESLGSRDSELADSLPRLQEHSKWLAERNPILAQRLTNFVTNYGADNLDELTSTALGGDVSDKENRLALIRRVQIVASKMTEAEKLKMANSVLNYELDGAKGLNELLALKTLLKSVEDTRKLNNVGEKDTNLPSIYTDLVSKWRHVKGAGQFCLLGETLEDFLREKSHAVTQYNIDTTLSIITIVCSRSGPSFPPSFAGTIFSHLCALLNVFLNAHRLKLQGHYHLLVQVLQSLLRCLFSPNFSTSTSSTSSSSSLPPWLLAAATNDASQILQPHHAELFTRIITQICDPTVSAVSHHHHHHHHSSVPLTSATTKAKNVAAQHMPLVLALYVRLRLDASLKISAEIREKLTPGIYAIFDTMTVEGRKVLGESLDAAGRAILVDLVRDWSRFGRWKGS